MSGGIDISDDELAVIQLALEHFVKARVGANLKHDAKNTLRKIQSYLEDGGGVQNEISSDEMLRRVRGYVKTAPAKFRFGPAKVFIGPIWDTVGRNSGWTRDQFDSWLTTQLREGTLLLVRADLVGAMDPNLVRDSEIRNMHATFHFVLDQDVRPY